MKLSLKSKKPKVDQLAGGDFSQPSLTLQLVNRYLRWIVLLIIAIILFTGYLFILSKKIKDLQNAAQQNLPAKERILTYLQDTQKRLNDKAIEFATFKTEKKPILDRLAKLLPDGQRYEELYAMLEYLAMNNNFQLLSINVAIQDTQTGLPGAQAAQTPPAGQPGVPQTAPSLPTANNQPKLKQLSVTIAVQGKPGYEEFKKFVGVLEHSIRLFDIKSVTYSELPTPTNGSETDQGANATEGSAAPAEVKAKYGFEMTTYYQE